MRDFTVTSAIMIVLFRVIYRISAKKSIIIALVTVKSLIT